MATCFEKLDGKKIIIGLAHLLPMPGTPLYKEGNLEAMTKKVVQDCVALKEGGASGALIQTVDVIDPNTDDCDYVRVAALAMMVARVRDAVGEDFLLGAQIMWNCITPSLAVCKAAGADFTRCTCLVGKTEAACGEITGNPLKVGEYRKKIGAEHIGLTNEVYGYHFKAEYSPERIRRMAMNSQNMGADAIEVMHSDSEMNERLVLDVKAGCNLPVLLGGYTSIADCKERLKFADGAFVGSALQGGRSEWGGSIQKERVIEYMKQVRELERETCR